MIRLVPFAAEDFSELIHWIDNEQLMHKWAGSLFSFPLTEKSLDWYVNNTNMPGKSDAYVFRVTDDEGQSIGHISLGGISWKNRSGRITRVFISKDQMGKGYCKLMVQAVCIIAFRELDLHRLSLGVYEDNAAALKCYQAVGFIQEGLHRDVFLFEENYWSMIEMGLLQHEWKALQQK